MRNHAAGQKTRTDHETENTNGSTGDDTASHTRKDADDTGNKTARI